MKIANGKTLGRPAPFTAEQVAALNSGRANTVQIAKILKTHSQSRPSKRSRVASKGEPIPLTKAELRQIVTGRGMSKRVMTALVKSTSSQAKLGRTGRRSRQPVYSPPPFTQKLKRPH